MSNSSLKKTLEVNKKQAEFYNTKKKNLPTRIWATIRAKTLKGVRQELNIQQESYDLHESWFGDLSQKKVLDLGCFAGNYHSLKLAKESKEYIGLDLSDTAIATLNKRLENIPTAKAVTADFLSEEFDEKEFDMIYAYGVLHHFEDVDLLISKLKEKLAPNGQIISYDPLETSPPVWLIRRLYRPFQSDAAWEWPFNRNTMRKLDANFNIIEKRGVLGLSKWYFIVNLLPLPKARKVAWGKKMHKKDWDQSNKSMSHLFKCMQLTMHMQRK